MKKNTLKMAAISLAVVTLTACGGGSDDSNPEQAPGPLSKYEGTWSPGCDGENERQTVSFTTLENGIKLGMNMQNEFFNQANCTGGIVATGTYGPPQPAATVTYLETVASASVRLPNGQTIQTSVDRVSTAGSGASFAYTGSGVQGTTVISGKKYWRIAYGGVSTLTNVNDASGTSVGALLLLNGELLELEPITSNYYRVISQLTR